MNEEAPEVRELKDKAEELNDLLPNSTFGKQDAEAKVKLPKPELRERSSDGERTADAASATYEQRQFADQTAQGAKQPVDSNVVSTCPLIGLLRALPIKVEQIVAETHHIDVNFATVPRVDRLH